MAILAGQGVEQTELVQPRQVVSDAGATTVLLSLEDGRVDGRVQTVERAMAFVRAFAESGKRTGATCHDPWTRRSSRMRSRS
ncbi:hypothetical protein ACWEN3_39495 [Streptomyces sp. NPDC004561]